MPGRISITLTFLCCGWLFFGCAETPKEPVLRPIPPPPSAPPPPPIVYVPQTVITANAPAATTAATPATPSEPSGNYEVSTNFVGNVQTPIVAGQTALNTTFTDPTALPQFEMVPARPGPNFEWRDGFWQWQGTAWVWVPGQWVLVPPRPSLSFRSFTVDGTLVRVGVGVRPLLSGARFRVLVRARFHPPGVDAPVRVDAS